MGNSKSLSEERRLSSRLGKNRTKIELTCPICSYTFIPDTDYFLIDEHINSHETTELAQPVEDRFFLKAEKKILPVRERLSSLRVHWTRAHVEVKVSRENLIIDSMKQLFAMSVENLRSEFHINFSGEISHDAGGLTKEWANLIISDLLSDEKGLFKLSQSNNPKYLPVKHNSSVSFYKLFGIVLGKSLLENIPIRCYLNRTVLKNILGQDCVLRDIKYQDTEVYNSLLYMLENKIDGIFFESFSVDSNGKIFDLVENGKNIPVTEENKETYILLRTEFEVYSAFSTAIEGIKEGFYAVIPKGALSGIRHKELSLMISGNPHINLNEWRDNTEYGGEYHSNHKVVRWMWEVLCVFDQKALAKFLQFVTGTSHVPIDGFKNLKTIRGDPALFKVVPVEFKSFPLPRAHTCFNRLDLPIYPNKFILKRALEEVINYHFGFGID